MQTNDRIVILFGGCHYAKWLIHRDSYRTIICRYGRETIGCTDYLGLTLIVMLQEMSDFMADFLVELRIVPVMSRGW